MLEPQARIVEPLRRIGAPSGDTMEAERAVTFRFPVRWSSLFVALESAKLPVPLVDFHEPAPAFAAAESLAPRLSEGSRQLPVEAHDSNSRSSVQWEMVVPKMVRQSGRVSPSAEVALPAQAPEPDIADDSIPRFRTERAWGFEWRRFTASFATRLIIGGALVAGATTPVLVRYYRSHASASMNTAGGGWTRESSMPVGAKQARQLVLYRPSLGAKDGRIEFTWKISEQALAWTFRAKDKDNYYAMAMKAVRPGASPALALEHFTVFQGIESAHASKLFILPENSATALQIRMDVNGATFRLYLGGNAADYWTDNRLASGGLGFIEQPEHALEVQSVRMSFSQTGGA